MEQNHQEKYKKPEESTRMEEEKTDNLNQDVEELERIRKREFMLRSMERVYRYLGLKKTGTRVKY